DKEEQKKIVEQWSTWTDPEISKITGNPPATKDDLKKVVYKQLETKGPMSPETKKKVDQGIDTIFEKVELTTAKAKDFEKPKGYAEGASPAESPPEQTQEKTAKSPPVKALADTKDRNAEIGKAFSKLPPGYKLEGTPDGGFHAKWEGDIRP